eukprot:bmy_06981T0
MEQKVKLLLFLQESGLAQLQPFGPSLGRCPTGVAGSGAGAGPASIPAGDRAAQRAASLRPWAPSQTQPSPDSRRQASWGSGDLRKRAGVLRSWDARQGWREGTSSGRWGRLSPPALAGCAGNVVRDAPWFAALPAAPLPQLSLRPVWGENAGPSHRRFARKGKAEDGS